MHAPSNLVNMMNEAASLRRVDGWLRSNLHVWPHSMLTHQLSVGPMTRCTIRDYQYITDGGWEHGTSINYPDK